jgi:hypothetical protein
MTRERELPGHRLMPVEEHATLGRGEKKGGLVEAAVGDRTLGGVEHATNVRRDHACLLLPDVFRRMTSERLAFERSHA